MKIRGRFLLVNKRSDRVLTAWRELCRTWAHERWFYGSKAFLPYLTLFGNPPDFLV